MLLYRLYMSFFSFSHFIVELFGFCEKFKKNSNFFFLILKKIMKSDMGILGGESDPLCPLYKFP